MCVSLKGTHLQLAHVKTRDPEGSFEGLQRRWETADGCVLVVYCRLFLVGFGRNFGALKTVTLLISVGLLGAFSVF